MNTTTNFNLRKPEPIDFYSVEDQNTNMDKIDETLSKMPQISDIEDVPVPILENARVYTTVDNNGQALAPRTVASVVTYGATNVEQALNSLIASGSAPYSETSTYALGAYCNQLGVMYKCTTAITSPEAWNAGHWTATSVAVELAGKSNTGHTHDDRYYTESETDTLLSGKSDSTHAHTAAQVGADASGTAASAVSTHNSSATAHNSRFDAKANAADLTAHTGNKQNPHEVTKGQVGLDNVPNVATNDQTPTYTAATTLATLTSGEKLSVAMGKIAKAIADLISHIADTTKHITAAERTAWNGKASGSHNHDNRYYTESEMNTKLAGKSDTNHNHANENINPLAIEFYGASSHGGYIDFHYGQSTADYTSRITESSNGVVTLNNNKILTYANITAIYSVEVIFSSGKAIYSNSAIKPTSICLVQRRSGTAGSATTSMFATTSGNGSLTIVTDNTSATDMNLNIIIINL